MYLLIDCIVINFGETLNEYKLFAQRIGLIGITNILTGISSILLLPILTKNLDIYSYGIWVQIFAITSLFATFGTLGLPYTMVRYLSAKTDVEEIKKSFFAMMSLVLISSFVLSFVFYLFSPQVSEYLFGGNIQVAQITSFIIFFTCLNNFLANYFRTFRQMKRYSAYSLFQTYLNLVIASYLAISGFEIFIIALGVLFTQVICFLIIMTIIVLEIGFKIPKFDNIKEYLSFGLPTIPGNLSSYIVDSSDRFLISIFLGISFVGYYNPGYTLAGFISMMLAPFTFLLPAVLPKHYDSNKMDKVNIYLKYSMKYFLTLAIPAAFGLSFLSKQLLTILTTTSIASEGYIVTPFVCLSYILFGAYGIIVNTMVLNYKTKIIAIAWFIAAILNVILNIFLIQIVGLVGAALATLIAYTTAFLIVFYYSRKYFEIDYFDVKFIVKSILASLLMSIIIIVYKPVEIYEIMLIIFLCAIIYFITLIMLKGFEKEEINTFKGFLSR